MAGRLDLIIEKGATFTKKFQWLTTDEATGVKTPVDLTGFTAEAMFREEIDSPIPFLTLTTADGSIELPVTEPGTIIFHVPPIISSAIVANGGIWDLELTSGTVVTRLLEGKVKLKPEVTRHG